MAISEDPSPTHKVVESWFTAWSDSFQEFQSIVGPAVNDVYPYCIVHVVLWRQSQCLCDATLRMREFDGQFLKDLG